MDRLPLSGLDTEALPDAIAFLRERAASVLMERTHDTGSETAPHLTVIKEADHALAAYDSGRVLVTPDDTGLTGTLTRLHAALEAVEQKSIDVVAHVVKQRLNKVHGRLVGAEVPSAAQSAVHVSQTITTVESGGEVVGMRIGDS